MVAPKIVSAPRTQSSSPSSGDFAKSASRAVFLAGLIYLLGSFIDLGILWIAQRQPGPQWQFVALTNTADAWPRLILSVALMYMGLHVGLVRSATPYRVLAGMLLLFGLIALVIGGMMLLNYLQVSESLGGDAVTMVRSAVVKTELLCGLYTVTLVPIGIMGLRLESRTKKGPHANQ